MRKKRVLPGFGLSLGFTMLYMSLFVLIPLSIVFIQTSQLGWKKFAGVITNERVLHSYQVSFTTSFAVAIVNAIFGLLIAWVLVRYKFPGKRLLDGLIDLPFALPTAVAGITLTTLYAKNGWIGKIFSLFHIKVAFTPLGIIVALTFIGLPFVVRMVQPVLQNIDKEVEEAFEFRCIPLTNICENHFTRNLSRSSCRFFTRICKSIRRIRICRFHRR